MTEPTTQDRKRWMATLAKARPEELEARWEALADKPRWTPLRAPESGMVMVRGRAGGTGAPFNLGEMTVTRCAVRLDGGVVGHAYVAGRSRRHAELAAVLDALMQVPERRAAVERAVVAPLERAHRERTQRAAEKAAATKVEFLTMVREQAR